MDLNSLPVELVRLVVASLIAIGVGFLLMLRDQTARDKDTFLYRSGQFGAYGGACGLVASMFWAFVWYLAQLIIQYQQHSVVPRF